MKESKILALKEVGILRRREKCFGNKNMVFCGMIVLFMIILAVLIFTGVIQLNNPSKDTFPVRGVDVSHYQGNIDWNELREQGIVFAYIKATEGASYEDDTFQCNWACVASASGLRGGAYHFFSFESPGRNQAENYIHTVSVIDDMLPPAIDVEPYGNYKTIKDVAGAVSEMSDWLKMVETEYGMRPVIYTTEKFYKGFIARAFPDYDIWIRSVYKQPSTSVQWTFWQYSDRVRLNGYDGEERYIDMNVFNGTMDDFEKYGH